MIRQVLFTAVMLGVEALVGVHWFLLPRNPALVALALVAGAVMTLMALADLALLVGVVRKRADDPQQARELADLARVEPLWAFVTVLQVAFIAAAFVAQVYWLGIVLSAGQGAELAAVTLARLRTSRAVGPAAPATG